MVSESTRFNVVCCGRRWGKTILGVNRLLIPAREGYPVAFFSPTYKMLAEVWRDVRSQVVGESERISTQEHRIELVGGGVVDMWSLDTPDVARGRKYKRVVIDEAAMVRDLGDAWQAVIRPTLTDYQGDAWFLSTPKGRNFFWQLWQRGQDQGQGEYKSWQMPTSANPYIKATEIEAARQELPERIFAQEYLAQFLDDAGGVFRYVKDAATAQRLETGDKARTYIMGVDWGKHNDFTVLTVLDAGSKAVVHMERFNQIDYALQTQRLSALQGRFRCKAIIAESNSMGEPLIEQLQRQGLPVRPFQTTNATKAEVIDALALAFERHEITIPDDATLIDELMAYEMERLPSGLFRYSAPEGMHDDCVISLALALYGATNRYEKPGVAKYA